MVSPQAGFYYNHQAQLTSLPGHLDAIWLPEDSDEEVPGQDFRGPGSNLVTPACRFGPESPSASPLCTPRFSPKNHYTVGEGREQPEPVSTP